jgi:hypothetical protein
LKVLIRDVLILIALVLPAVLVAYVWFRDGYSLAGLDYFPAGTFQLGILPLLLVLVVFVKPSNEPSILRFRGIANLVGGGLPLLSLFFPYRFYGGYWPWYPLDPGPVSEGIPQLILLGCLMTFFSRFGVIVTVAGLDIWSSTPILCPLPGCPPIVVGPGFWLAWAGVIVSLIGRSWIVFPRNLLRQKFLGLIMLPAGLIVAVLGGVLLPYSWSTDKFGMVLDLGPFFIPRYILSPTFEAIGLLFSGAGLILFLGLGSTTASQIQRALQKPIW